MNDPSGRVISVRSTSVGDSALIEVDAGEICARCAAGKGCGAGLLGSGSRLRQINASVAENVHIDGGDYVRISLQPGNVLRAAIIVYAYPLAGALLGAIAANRLGLSDLSAAMAALAGIGFGLVLAKISLRNARCLSAFTPVVAERLSSPPGR